MYKYKIDYAKISLSLIFIKTTWIIEETFCFQSQSRLVLSTAELKYKNQNK